MLKKTKYGGHFEIQNGRRRRIRKKWNQLSKMAAEDAFEKNGTNSGFVRKGIRMQKNIGSTSIGNFALDYITPCTRFGSGRTNTLIVQ